MRGATRRFPRSSCCSRPDARRLSPSSRAHERWGRGTEVTAHYSAVSISGDKIQDDLGLQAGFGISETIDARLRYEAIWVEGLNTYHVIGFGPKFAMDASLAALYLPVGCAFGEDVDTPETWQFHPTLLLTNEASPSVEVNISLKYMMTLDTEDDPNSRFAINFGLGIGPGSLRYVLRPEVGIMLQSEVDPIVHIGFGVSFDTTERERLRHRNRKIHTR